MATLKKLDKNSYEVRWDETDADGKRHQRRKRFGRKGAATDFMDGLRGGDVERLDQKLLFGDWLDDWFAAYSSRLEVTSVMSYQRIVDRAKAYFGDRELSKITPTVIDRWYADMAAADHPLTPKPLSSSTIQRHHAVMHRAFEFAVRDGIIAANPFDRVDRPASSTQEIDVPDMEAVKARLEALRGSALYMPVALLFFTGMRRSEGLGLMWQDVDLRAKTITVQRVRLRVGADNLQQLRLNAVTKADPTGGGWVLRERTKSKKNRTVIIPDEMVAILADARSEQVKNRLRMGSRYTATDFVFVGGDGAPIPDNTLSKTMRGVCRLHDLRHLNATYLLGKGISVADVARRLGHTTPQTTLKVYAHAMDAGNQAAADAMGDAFQTTSGRNVARREDK